MKYPQQTEQRVQAALARIETMIYSERVPLDCAVWPVGGEPVAPSRAFRARYTPCEPGYAWGPLWDTSWFRFRGKVPAAWRGKRVVALVSVTPPRQTEGFSAEGLVYWNGVPKVAVNAHRKEIEIAAKARGEEEFEFFVEAAANLSSPRGEAQTPAQPNYQGQKLFRLEQAELAVSDPEATAYYHDYRVCLEAMNALVSNPRRRAELREALNTSLNLLEEDKPSSLKLARRALAGVLAERNGTASHIVTAVGHAHIDTAWLWPLRESIRKCARTFATALHYMEKYPDYVFLCSQPQQYAWMKAYYPEIWEGIKKAVRRGRWEPAGSMWIEADCNLASGEALVRQLLHGKKFFLEEFGIETRDLWLPDVFGYPASLPSIMAGAGIEFFLTQKISWNQFNKFPHHTFWWEGLDGSRIFTHFPPADTYNSVLGPAELQRCAEAFREHGRSRRSLVVYGYGDGGGGPSIPMLEAAQRLHDFDGLPRLELGKASTFFEKARAEAEQLSVWSGELYLELHRGTFTSQAAVKRGNRKSELLLRDTEFLDAVDSALRPSRKESLPQPPRAIYDVGALDHPNPRSHAAALERAWKLLLLNQFHDILPGSSIHWVYEDAARDYQTIAELGGAVKNAALAGLASQIETQGLRNPALIVNTLGFRRQEIVKLPGGRPAFVDVPPFGYAVVEAAEPHELVEKPVKVSRSNSGITLENGLLRLRFNSRGQLVSLFDLQERREVLAQGQTGNTLILHEDYPLRWDAWDVDIFYREKARFLEATTPPSLLESGPLQAVLMWSATFGSSRLQQRIILRAGSARVDFETEVDWHESHQFLKVAFPVDVRSAAASFETGFGHVRRPTHANTSWDLARFEVCAHRWADLSETGYGVALLNDCKYGYDVTGSTLRLSLLRAPSAPDPSADRGIHHFTYSIFPHAGDLRDGRVVEEAAALNRPLLVQEIPATRGAGLPLSHSFLSCTHPSAVIEAVKRAEDGRGIIVRVYEAHGSRARAKLRYGLPFRKAHRCDLLERPLETLPTRDQEISFELRPFEITTFRFDS